MVTPLSQYVGTQAAINVILGERYKEVPDQVIQYALGIWGKEGAELMDPQVKDKILSRPRAREWTRWEQPDPSLHEVRQRFGANVSDEELILRFFADDAVDALPDGGKPREYLTDTTTVKLIEQLIRKRIPPDLYQVPASQRLKTGRSRDA
jgi:oxaloacetate decarboxylase alpha subunit